MFQEFRNKTEGVCSPNSLGTTDIEEMATNIKVLANLTKSDLEEFVEEMWKIKKENKEEKKDHR